MEEIFARIKQIRKDKGMTLKELSQLTGFSISYLSQVEREMSSITMTSLNKILQALDVTMQELFGNSTSDNEVEDVYIHQNNDHMLEGVQKIYSRFNVVSGRFSDRKMDTYRFTMCAESACEESIHSGEEFYIVMKGIATFEIEGKEYVVKEGSTIHFPSTKLHCIRNKESTELDMYGVISPIVF